ncbi:hypothetical protein F2981_31975 (plasmid) [Sinorhizobium meliloti]|nr:hypothetical protein [Sinorhizobium meliloti]
MLSSLSATRRQPRAALRVETLATRGPSAISWKRDRPGSSCSTLLCGGISEAKKIATMAEAWHLPVAPHDCNRALWCSQPRRIYPGNANRNAPRQEKRACYYKTWYPPTLRAAATVTNGMITIPPGGRARGSISLPDLDRKFEVSRAQFEGLKAGLTVSSSRTTCRRLQSCDRTRRHGTRRDRVRTSRASETSIDEVHALL